MSFIILSLIELLMLIPDKQFFLERDEFLALRRKVNNGSIATIGFHPKVHISNKIIRDKSKILKESN